MPQDTLVISCPKCGKLNDVAFGDAATRRETEHRCENCGTTFPVDLDQVRMDER